jgi:hypothetical protein
MVSTQGRIYRGSRLGLGQMFLSKLVQSPKLPWSISEEVHVNDAADGPGTLRPSFCCVAMVICIPSVVAHGPRIYNEEVGPLSCTSKSPREYLKNTSLQSQRAPERGVGTDLLQ